MGVIVLRGQVVFHTEEARTLLNPGNFVSNLAASHTLQAVGDAAVLITSISVGSRND